MTSHSLHGSLTGIGRNSAIAATGMMLNGPLTYLIAICLTRWLGAGGFGLYTLLLAVVGAFTVLSSLGMQVGAARFVAHYLGLDQPDKAAAAFKALSCISLAASAVAGLLLWWNSDGLAALLAKPDLAPLLRIGALFVPALVLQDVWLYTLRGMQRIGRQILIEKLAAPALTATLTVAFVVLKLDLPGFLYWLAALNYLIAAMVGWVTVREFRGCAGTALQKSELVDLLRYSLPVMLEKMIQVLLLQAGVEMFLIARYGSAADLGVYGLLYRIVPFMMLPATALSIAFGPTVAGLYARRQTALLQRNFGVVNRWIAMLTFPLYLLLIVWSTPILQLSGGEFAGGRLALSILAAGFLVDALVGEVRGIMLMTGKSGLFLVNSICLVALNLSLNLLLVPRWGIVGAASASAISRALLNLIGLGQVFVFIGIHPFRRDYWKPVAAALITAGAYWSAARLLPEHQLTGAWLSSLILLVIYLASLAALGLPAEERSGLDLILRRFAKREYGNAS